MDTRSRRRVPRVDPRVFDAGVAVVLFVLLALSFGASVRAGQRPVDAWAWVLGALLTAPYAVHRRVPWVALAVALAALVAFSLMHYAPYPGLSVFVLLFGITLHGRRRDSLVALGATAVAFVVALLAQPAGVVAVSDVISTMLATAVAWLAGDNLRQRRLRWEAMEERARMLEREREDRDRAAVAAERLRIARELHDVVAHSMSVIAVQAGVGRHVIDTDVAAARNALGVIESTSRDALTEMRRMLGVLRQGDEAAARRPMPGLADVPTLVVETRRAGLGVTLDSTGAVRDLPAGVDLTAYRVVQEALTNVLKHGGPVAHVRIACSDDRVELEVTDEGRPVSVGSGGSKGFGGSAGVGGSTGVGGSDPGGHGLLGMGERVALYGGSFEAMPRPGGGFRVHASLPYAAGSA
jgi:signal transduction histidine kinase